MHRWFSYEYRSIHTASQAPRDGPLVVISLSCTRASGDILHLFEMPGSPTVSMYPFDSVERMGNVATIQGGVGEDASGWLKGI